MKTKIITGTAKEVEKEINKWGETHSIMFGGISATDNLTTVMIQVYPLPV